MFARTTLFFSSRRFVTAYKHTGPLGFLVSSEGRDTESAAMSLRKGREGEGGSYCQHRDWIPQPLDPELTALT